MFAKLKKKIAEESATAPRSSIRIPRAISKESITSVGADSGDDFASDGSSSRDDMPAQLLRRNDQIRKLEAKLSDYAEQLRIMRTTKDKLEIALEKHQDSSIKKLQEKNESYQVSRNRMAEGMALALEKKDQEWMEKMAAVENEKAALSARLEEMMEQRLTLFQKQHYLDDLEGFQQQELAKIKNMLLKKEEQLSKQGHQLQKKNTQAQLANEGLSEFRGKLLALEHGHDESCILNPELEVERAELLLLREESDKKVNELEQQCQELQSVIQQVSEDFQKSQSMVSTLEGSLQALQTEHKALRLQQQKASVREEHKDCLLKDLQIKTVSLERRLQGHLSQDEHLQERLQEKQRLEQSLEESRAELLAVQTNYSDIVSSLEAQIADLKQQVLESSKKLQSADQQITEKEQHIDKLADLDHRKTEANSIPRQQRDELEQCRIEELIASLQRSKQELSTVNEKLALREENIKTLQNEVQHRQVALVQLQDKMEHQQAQLKQMELDKGSQLITLRKELLNQTKQLDTYQTRISYLEVEVETLTEQLQSPQVCEEDPNGSVIVDDLVHVQKVNRELEQQLNDKNKTIRQLQQRLAELRRTLQKELKLKSEPGTEGKEKLPESRTDKQERVCSDPLTPFTVSPPTSYCMVTNTADLNDSREINLEYLKHVVLKFMSSREAEAFQLIRAVSVLLNFTREEEELLKQTLEYKMSWFGSKPSPKGIIRPSASGTLTHWN